MGRISQAAGNQFSPGLDPALIANIDNSLLEKEEEVTIEWAEEYQTYDVRGRKDLGKAPHPEDGSEPMGTIGLYALVPAALRNAGCQCHSGARAGEMVEAVLTDEVARPEGSFRLVHLDFQTPAGDRYELYARNALVKTTPYVERVPFAFNDPKGNWKVIAHDLMTGQVVEASFQSGV